MLKDPMLLLEILYIIKIGIEDRQFYRGNCGKGVLTERGYDQHVINGRFLKQNYGNFLPPRINRDIFESKFYVRSTNIPRTFLSAESLLSGLYPPQTRDGDFYININTMDEERENLISNSYICPKIVDYDQQYRASDFYKNHTKMVTAPLENKLAQLLKLNISDIFLPAIFDCWISHVCHGFPLPDNITPEILGQITKEGEWQYGNMYNYPTREAYSKVCLGKFFQEYLSVFQKVRMDPNNTLAFALYSAHDTTIMPFLSALNAWDKLWPSYAATIIAEYYEVSNPYIPSVRMIYNGIPIIIPGCGNEFCPYPVFEKIVSSIIPTDNDCRATPVSNNRYEDMDTSHPRFN